MLYLFKYIYNFIVRRFSSDYPEVLHSQGLMEETEKFVTNGNQLGYTISDFQFLKTLGN